MKNIVLNKEIKLTNPDNLVNLIHIDKLIEYINRFVNSSKNSATYTSKYSISVGNLEKLLKKLIEDEMCKLGDFLVTKIDFKHWIISMVNLQFPI